MIIERYTNNDLFTYEISYQAFDKMYKFIEENIDIQKLQEELSKFKLAKQRKKLPSDNKTLQKVSKTEYLTYKYVE